MNLNGSSQSEIATIRQRYVVRQVPAAYSV